jgi:hypothetical protein
VSSLFSRCQCAAGEADVVPLERSIGVGETDFGDDYRAGRERGEGWVPLDAETLSLTAFERALADSGLVRADIDGLTVSYTFGGPIRMSWRRHWVSRRNIVR